MLHIIASKLAKRHHSTIRVGLALLILHKSPPASGRLLKPPTTLVKPIKQRGSAAQTCILPMLPLIKIKTALCMCNLLV